MVKTVWYLPLHDEQHCTPHSSAFWKNCCRTDTVTFLNVWQNFPMNSNMLGIYFVSSFFFLRFVYLLIKRQREKSFIYRVTPQMDATSGTVSGWCLEPVIPSRSLMWVEGPKDQAIICSIMEANLVYQDSERWCSSHKQKLNLVFNTHPSNL